MAHGSALSPLQAQRKRLLSIRIARAAHAPRPIRTASATGARWSRTPNPCRVLVTPARLPPGLGCEDKLKKKAVTNSKNQHRRAEIPHGSYISLHGDAPLPSCRRPSRPRQRSRPGPRQGQTSPRRDEPRQPREPVGHLAAPTLVLHL